jgi:1-acyl-sn-glycerol-3-phosphate acyltransferase
MSASQTTETKAPENAAKNAEPQTVILAPDKVNPVYARTRWLCKFVIGFVGKVDIQGKENIPETGPVILASNHRAHVDPPYLSAVTNRQMYFMAKEELFTTNDRFGKYLYELGAFPVRRGESDRAALRMAISILKQGLPLTIFPEGTRSFDDSLLPAEKGFALIAKQTGAPIVPIALEGTHKVWPKGTKLLHRGPVAITIGKPVTAREILEAHPDAGKDALDIIGQEVMRRIAALMRFSKATVASQAE